MREFEIEYDNGYVNCDICHQHENKKVAKIHYHTRNWVGKNGRVCKKLQKHERCIWICTDCIEKFDKAWKRTEKERWKSWFENDEG